MQDPLSSADAEGTLESAPFRFYHPTQGRWPSPDPLASEILNPQSLNRCAGVLNNPTSLIHPLGLDDCTFDTSDRNKPDNLICYADNITLQQYGSYY